MSSIEVVVRGSLVGEVVRLRPLLTKKTAQTRISSRLAKQLGLTEFRDIYISNVEGDECDLWKVSIFPIKIWCHNMVESRSLSIYPIVNCNPQDAYYDMIIGRDGFSQLKNIAEHTNKTKPWTEPTRGPGFDPRKVVSVPVEFVPIARLPSRVNAFFEYNCDNSKSVLRLALNKVTRQLAAVFRSSCTVYCYAGVSKRLEVDIERGESRGATLSQVKQQCNYNVIDAFPMATLVEPDFGVAL
jgi:hypothetical protein